MDKNINVIIVSSCSFLCRLSFVTCTQLDQIWSIPYFTMKNLVHSNAYLYQEGTEGQFRNAPISKEIFLKAYPYCAPNFMLVLSKAQFLKFLVHIYLQDYQCILGFKAVLKDKALLHFY